MKKSRFGEICDSQMRFRQHMGKLSIGVVELYNDGVVQVVTFTYHLLASFLFILLKLLK